MSKRIHIVSFDVPFPADYGGVIDVFTRVKWFSENGWQVVLHCFEYHRPKAPELKEYAEVHYYSRPKGLKYWFSKLPFIVNTRVNEKLVDILKETKDEVILEGLHCAYYLNIQPGKFYLRAHNIEHEYYQKLIKNASFLKQIFFRSEARKLKNYEPILTKAKGLFVISEGEMSHFQRLNENSILVPSIVEIPKEKRVTKPYVLFHGNLSVEENEQAAYWILDEIKPRLKNIEFRIAGKNPSFDLVQKAKVNDVSIRSNPTEGEMQELIQKARVHLLWTNNSSGLKLKFMQSMATSGHVICSPEMVAGSSIKEGFHVFNSATEAILLIEELYLKTISENEYETRMKQLGSISGANKLRELFLNSK